MCALQNTPQATFCRLRRVSVFPLYREKNGWALKNLFKNNPEFMCVLPVELFQLSDI
jgi:hypothetical protein